jgi:hypothetical protein
MISIADHEKTNFHFCPARSGDDAHLLCVGQARQHHHDDYDHHDPSATTEVAAGNQASGDDAWYGGLGQETVPDS